MGIKIYIKSSKIEDFYKNHGKEIEETSAIIAEDTKNQIIVTLSNEGGIPYISVIDEYNNKDIYASASEIENLEKDVDDIYVEFISGGFVSAPPEVYDEAKDRQLEVKDALWDFLSQITNQNKELISESYELEAEDIISDIGTLLSEYYGIYMFYPIILDSGNISEYPF